MFDLTVAVLYEKFFTTITLSIGVNAFSLPPYSEEQT